MSILFISAFIFLVSFLLNLGAIYTSLSSFFKCKVRLVRFFEIFLVSWGKMVLLQTSLLELVFAASHRFWIFMLLFSFVCRHSLISLVIHWLLQFSSVHSVVSDSLWPHGLQRARLPCTSPSPGACSNSCPLSLWCHPTTSSSAIPFFSCFQSFPASGSFQMSQFFTSGGQSIGASASVWGLSMNIKDWFPLELTGFISFQSKDSQESSPIGCLVVCYFTSVCWWFL